MKRTWERFAGFLFPVETGGWLSILRIGLGLQVVLYALSLESDWNSLFAGSEGGPVGRAFSEGLLLRQSPLVPQLGWWIAAGGRIGLSEWTVLSITWWTLFCAGCCLLAGVFSRASAILAWFVHLCAAKSGDLVSYGVDNFMTIGLFYLMLSPLPDRYALEQRWRKARPQRPERLGFWRRVLQVHVCLIYFFSGLAKILGNGWWNGSNLWLALTRPPSNVVPTDALISLKHVFPAAGIAVCVLELGYPFAIWRKKTRFAWWISIIAMHLTIGAVMGMYLFSLVMIVLNVAAFGPGLIFARNRPAQSDSTERVANPAAEAI